MTAQRTAGQHGAGNGRVRGRRLQRGDLSRDLIVTESLRLLDTEGTAGFSLPKLGRALGADPTAVYRHFASKDDLVLAVADLLIEESATGLVRTDCWVETLREGCRRLRDRWAELGGCSGARTCGRSPSCTGRCGSTASIPSTRLTTPT